PNLVALLPRMIGRQQMLAPVLDEFDRPQETPRCDQYQNVLRIELAAYAEAAAGVAFVEMELGEAEPQHVGQGFAILVRHLGGAIELEHVARRIVAADRATGLDRYSGVATDPEVELNDITRAVEGWAEITEALLADGGRGREAGRELTRLG